MTPPDATPPETYRDECHLGCETRFIGISREEYVEHLRDDHGEFKADLWETLVVQE